MSALNAPSSTIESPPGLTASHALAGEPWAARLRRCGRVVFRAALLSGVFIAAAMDFGWRSTVERRRGYSRFRSQWLSRWSRVALRVLHVSVRSSGVPPSGGLLVANHLSYLDILVLAAERPMTFVSKAEVADWPVVGRFVRWAGTILHPRTVRSELPNTADAMCDRVQAGELVVLFPEGTSSDGARVLPFHSALFASAARHQWPVTAAWLGYSAPDGRVEDDVCFWRDMLFLPHLFRLLGLRSITARVVFGSSALVSSDRKWLAREARAQVMALGDLATRPSGLAGTGA
ncbi:MAG: 1-acyl-sn-glycerol-3-phosphate acyltransferase [Verrucomicrobia bacterium]|nr:1-acyl-sn-glycerol-3-phosphate acyltransferase [Verrucomicrobiota bacterium]